MIVDVDSGSKFFFFFKLPILVDFLITCFIL